MRSHGWSLVGAALAALALAPAASAAGFVVDDLSDADRPYPAGTCASPCTLRDAIQAVNSGPGTGDTIAFSVTGRISVTSGLPPLTASVAIDGGSLGAVQLDSVPSRNFGLQFSAGASTVQRLVLTRFDMAILASGTAEACSRSAPRRST